MSNINNPIVKENFNDSFIKQTPVNVSNPTEPTPNVMISKSINFYKGTSFRWVGLWTPGKSYVNDEFFIDTVYYKGKTWTCLKSHISDADTSPYEGSSYWHISLQQSGSGVHVGVTPPSMEEYGELSEKMIWLDVSEDSDFTKVYSAEQTNEQLSHKAGIFHPAEDGRQYLVFADAESRDIYLENPERDDLVLATINTNFVSEQALNKIVSDEITKVIADAPEDFDTLREISDFIQSDAANAAEILKNMDSLNNRVTDIENNKYVVLSESEYEELAEKEDRLYFLYEEQ